jgi:phosphonate transport system substrate-binding protein
MISKRTGRTAVAGIIFMALLAAFCPGPASAEIRFITVPRLSAAELQTIYAPLIEYLTREAGEKVTLVVPKNFDGVEEAVKAGKADIGFVNPLIYIQMKKSVNIEPLALSSEVKSGTRLRGVIITRKDSNVTKLQDLKGKKFSFVEEDSPAGHIFQKLLLSRAGFDLKKDVIMLPYAKTHEGVVTAVFNRTADAGGVREEQLDKMKGSLDTSQLKIVGYTDYFPNWPFFSTSSLKKASADKIRDALLKLKPNDPQNVNILGPARLTGFIPVSDKEYDDLRAAARLVGAL